MKSIGMFIIASAIIWGAVIIGCSAALSGTGCYAEIQNILVGGVILHLIIIWGPLTVFIKKLGKSSEGEIKNK
ncbi:hypothetical protein ACFLSS_03925 [Bacteroidota bacterium]